MVGTGDLAAHRILDAEHRANRKSDRVVPPPVHRQIHVDASPFRRRDPQLRELWRPAHCFDVMPRPVQLVRQLVDGALESSRVKIVGEKVHVMGKTIDHPVLTNRTRAGESERAAIKGSERRGG